MPTVLPAPLESLVARLPNSLCPLAGASVKHLVVPENVACFNRTFAHEMNMPGQGRTLHHRYVLMAALKTSVTVCVDDREIVLQAGHGMLLLPFQFHHYLPSEHDDILWLFVTFEFADSMVLEPMRFRPFMLTAETRELLRNLLIADAQKAEKAVVLLLALLLARLRAARPIRQRRSARTEPSIVMQVNKLTEGSRDPLSLKQLARRLGISPSHLRGRFAASCGVSLGRHLRQLRLQKACGLLRLSSERVSEIADTCGFNSIYTFSRAFQRAYGLSPLAYRRAGQVKRAANGEGKTGLGNRALRRT